MSWTTQPHSPRFRNSTPTKGSLVLPPRASSQVGGFHVPDGCILIEYLGKLMAAVADLPKRVVVALAHAIKYLSAFGVADAFLETNFFMKFATQAHMLLAANTLMNLEVYRNETDNTTRGSLIWILDRTKTKFGARLLRNWVGRPLVDKR